MMMTMQSDNTVIFPDIYRFSFYLTIITNIILMMIALTGIIEWSDRTIYISLFIPVGIICMVLVAIGALYLRLNWQNQYVVENVKTYLKAFNYLVLFDVFFSIFLTMRYANT